MAVPDEMIGPITDDIVPEVDSGTMIVLLDPAAAYADVLYTREDITYFLTHPCHPSFFTAETKMDDENTDWFGGQGRDTQDIVCSLHYGPEDDYARGEAIVRDTYSPVRNVHRVATEEMALLEPALVETLLATCLYTIRDGYERVVKMGVPEDAAREFLFGHRIENRSPGYRDLIADLHEHTGDAEVIGVTGSPGAGKSTLVDKLAKAYRDEGLTVGVIAVDPSSPYTGRAVLGDRI